MGDLFAILEKLQTNLNNNTMYELYPELKKGLYRKNNYNKKYYENNKQEIKKVKSIWYYKNNNKYVQCDCGSYIKIFGMKSHLKTEKHINYEILNKEKKEALKYFICQCGSIVVNVNHCILRHKNTNKHKKYLKFKNLP